MLGIRLIDANALEDELNRWVDENPVLYDYGDDGFDYGVIEGIEFCLRMLQRAPTINPDDLRPKGTWINDPPYRSLVNGNWLKAQMCSACGALYVSDGNKPYSNHNYCAECGAEMER